MATLTGWLEENELTENSKGIVRERKKISKNSPSFEKPEEESISRKGKSILWSEWHVVARLAHEWILLNPNS